METKTKMTQRDKILKYIIDYGIITVRDALLISTTLPSAIP